MALANPKSMEATNIALALTCYDLINNPVARCVCEALAGDLDRSRYDDVTVDAARIALRSALTVTKEQACDTSRIKEALELVARR